VLTPHSGTRIIGHKARYTGEICFRLPFSRALLQYHQINVRRQLCKPLQQRNLGR
jgi:hypothetical protein